MITPQGYTPGITTEQAAAQPQAQLSRADDIFTPKRQLDEMIATKRVLINSIRAVQDDAYYARERKRLQFQVDQITAQIEGLESRRINGPNMIARLEREIADLETKRAATECKSDMQRYVEMMFQVQSMLGET